VSSEFSAHAVESVTFVIGALPFGLLFLAIVELGWSSSRIAFCLSGRAETAPVSEVASSVT
jgi:hypothetical protein